MNLSFQGKTVLVTGASRGIGLGVARGFAALGGDVHILADDDGVFGAAKELGARPYKVDITDGDAVQDALSTIPRIDVLINNAGFERMTPLVSESERVEEVFRRIIEINVIGTSTVTRRSIARMRPGSAIVNTASIWGRVAEAQFDAYVASKHAIIGLTKTWAKELGPLGIRVNAVCPGWVRTEASMRSLSLMAAARGTNEAGLLADIVAGQALAGLMEPDDMQEAYLFLASECATNITGQSLGVDRGEVPW